MEQEAEIIGYSIGRDGTEIPIPLLSAKELDDMYTDLFYSKPRPWKRPSITIAPQSEDSPLVKELLGQWKTLLSKSH